MRNSVTKSLLGDREVSVQLAIRYVVWSLSRYSLADNRVPHQYLMNAWSNQEQFRIAWPFRFNYNFLKMPMLNMYSKNRRMQEGHSTLDVTGHDRFGPQRRFHHRSAPTFASSPKWRQRKEAELRQKRRQLERRQSSVSYPPTNLLSTESSRAAAGVGDRGSCGNIYMAHHRHHHQDAEAVYDDPFPSSPALGLEWLCRRFQHLICRFGTSFRISNQPSDIQLADVGGSVPIPRWVSVCSYSIDFLCWHNNQKKKRLKYFVMGKNVWKSQTNRCATTTVEAEVYWVVASERLSPEWLRVVYGELCVLYCTLLCLLRSKSYFIYRHLFSVWKKGGVQAVRSVSCYRWRIKSDRLHQGTFTLPATDNKETPLYLKITK